jgi:transcription termination factor Rho
MAPEQQLERSMLDGKDREELHAIAGAMGVKGVTRLRKADLVDAILNAAGGEGGSAEPAGRASKATKATKSAKNGADTASPAKRAVRSKKASELEAESIDALAAEEDALAAAASEGEPEIAPRPQRAGDDDAASATAALHVDPEDERASYGEGNRTGRRRRRRGRDRTDRPAEGEPREQFTGEPIEVQGLLDLRDEGYGFLRTSGYLAGRSDVYVSASQVRRFALRKGDHVKGATRPPASNEKYPALLRVDEINGMTPDDARTRPRFEELTPLFPDQPLRLGLPDEPQQLTGRIIDLLSPIGKGQRGLIVSPPKAGKTTILKQIVYSIERNNPEVHLMVLLVDERPEEVTDMRRHVLRGEVVASTFDRPSDEHTHVAELAIERAKRLVEQGKDVVIVLDGITRLARAYNLSAPASGRILSGGVDSTALYPPKRFFGAARNIEEGGSLTIIATALIETGSRMDEVIFEEFKGTGNMELRLDRKLAERRLYPAIDVNASSTRHEELLFDRNQLNQVWKLRRVLNALAQDGSGAPGLELLIDKLRTTRSNDEFLAEIAKNPGA